MYIFFFDRVIRVTIKYICSTYGSHMARRKGFLEVTGITGADENGKRGNVEIGESRSGAIVRAGTRWERMRKRVVKSGIEVQKRGVCI